MNSKADAIGRLLSITANEKRELSSEREMEMELIKPSISRHGELVKQVAKAELFSDTDYHSFRKADIYLYLRSDIRFGP